MSNLHKTRRALDFDEAWPDILLMACQIEGAEYTRELTTAVTMTLADQIGFNEDTLEIDVSGVSDEDVIETVRRLKPAPVPEPEPVVEPVPEPDEAD